MNQRLIRKFHRQLAPILFLPLFVTALTGMAYRIADIGLKIPNRKIHFLMEIHRGSFLGQFQIGYLLLNGLGLVVMLFTGIYMLNMFFSKPKSQKK